MRNRILPVALGVVFVLGACTDAQKQDGQSDTSQSNESQVAAFSDPAHAPLGYVPETAEDPNQIEDSPEAPYCDRLIVGKARLEELLADGDPSLDIPPDDPQIRVSLDETNAQLAQHKCRVDGPREQPSSGAPSAPGREQQCQGIAEMLPQFRARAEAGDEAARRDLLIANLTNSAIGCDAPGGPASLPQSDCDVIVRLLAATLPMAASGDASANELLSQTRLAASTNQCQTPADLEQKLASQEEKYRQEMIASAPQRECQQLKSQIDAAGRAAQGGNIPAMQRRANLQATFAMKGCPSILSRPAADPADPVEQGDRAVPETECERLAQARLDAAARAEAGDITALQLKAQIEVAMVAEQCGSQR